MTKACIMISLCVFVNLNFSHAIKISELMYDPVGSKTGHLWVEIYNDESVAVNLTLLKLRESNSNHSIVGIAGANLLSPHEYGIIADDDVNFKKDYEKHFSKAYTGKLYKASYVLPDKGEKISIMAKLSGSTFNEIYSIDYTPFVGSMTGHSICDVNVETASITWHECIDTAGSSNQIFEDNTIGIVPTSTPTSTDSIASTTNYNVVSNVPVGINYYVPNTNIYIKVGDLTVQSIKDKNVMTGAEFDMVVRAYDGKGIAIKNLKYYWSMGDGGYFEGETIKYIYHLPGAYDYSVEVGDDNSYAMYRGTITAHDPKISFALIATNTNQIVLHNSLNTEIDVGSFLLRDNTNNKTFKIARNTFIKSNSDLKLNGKAMGFISTSSDSFTLLATNGIILARYTRPDTNIKPDTKSEIRPNISSVSNLVVVSNQIQSAVLPVGKLREAVKGLIKNNIIYKHEVSLKR